MKSKLMPSIVLGSICLVVALLLSVVNMFTAPIIAKNQDDKANAAFAEILPGATGKQGLTIDQSYPKAVTAGYKFDNGYVFQMTVAGYKPGLVIMCGIDNEGKITGMKHIQSSETFGLETELNGAYVGETLESAELVIATGATAKSLTSKAYYNAAKAALQAFVIANGGSVDIRTPEQIIQDGCNTALGVSGKTFERFFSSWSVIKDGEVYTSDAGTVIVIGDVFVGYPKGASAPVGVYGQDILNAASEIYEDFSSVEKINLSEFTGIKASVKSAYKNASGEYMLSLSAKGFEWAAEPMVIELIINGDGVITSCVTVSHSESGGYGSVCGTPEYYNQYVGKTAETYTDVPPIVATAPDVTPGPNGGATQTSSGYKSAIAAGFEAFNIVKGGNQ